MRPTKFWPFDYDEEDEIYENPAWDMPGLRKLRSGARKPSDRRPEERRFQR